MFIVLNLQIWWAIGSAFGALLALGVLDTIGWHWFLGIATFPLAAVLLLFPVSACDILQSISVSVYTSVI